MHLARASRVMPERQPSASRRPATGRLEVGSEGVGQVVMGSGEGRKAQYGKAEDQQSGLVNVEP